MELKQVNIFGEYDNLKVIKKNDTKIKKVIKENENLKQKIKILYKMYEQLYEKQNISILEPRDIIIRNNIVIYPEDRQAEPIDTITLGIYEIDERIEIMKKTLGING